MARDNKMIRLRFRKKMVTYIDQTHLIVPSTRLLKNKPKNGHLIKMSVRGISLNVLRVDRILEGVVGVQEYKHFVNPGSNISRGIASNVWPRVDRILVLLLLKFCQPSKHSKICL